MSTPTTRGETPGLGGALTGLLLYTASPGVDVWPLAFIALVPLMLVVARASLRRSLLEGLLAGVFLFAPGLGWLPDFFQSASLASGAVAWLAYAAIVAATSTKLCVACATAWLLIRARTYSTLAFAFGFAAGELAIPGLVPYTISASLYSVSPLLQIAEWGGSTWIVALLAAVNAALAASLRARSRRERGRAAILAVVLLLVWVCVGVWLAERARATVIRSSASSRVLIVQPAIGAQLKKTQPSHVVSLYREATVRALAADRADWVIWGETAFAAAIDEARLDPTLRARTRGGIGVPLLAGVAIRGDGDKLYNSAVSIDSAGRVCASCRYDKQRLVPLAEEMPALTGILRTKTSSTPQSRFDRGVGSNWPLRINDHPIAIAICYEALYAGDFRKQVSEHHPEVLVSLASDLWLSSERAKKLHVALIQLRAIEHRRFLVHATVGAASAVIDPLGRVDAQTPAGAADVKFATVPWLRGSTLWTRVGDLPFWTSFIVLVLSRAVRRGLAQV